MNLKILYSIGVMGENNSAKNNMKPIKISVNIHAADISLSFFRRTQGRN